MDPKHLARLDQQHLWHPFTQHRAWAEADPLIVVQAEGCWLIDDQGRRYLDGVSSLWTNVHGHRHPRIDAAVRAQLDRVAHSTLLGLTHPPAIELAARLVEVAPPGLNKVFYSDSGATAVEVALKMAFQYQRQAGQPGRTRFAALADGYHGDTLGAVAVGSVEVFHEVFRPLLFDVVVLPAPRTPGGEEEARCLAEGLALLEAHGPELAAVVVEPLVQGAAGMKMHSAAFLHRLLAKAREVGALVVADEVAVGFGRTGTLFAMEQVGLQPDLLCLAKGLSGGYLPLAATLATDRVYEAFLGDPADYRQFFHGHTYTGNPLACAAALATLDLFEEEGTLAHVGRLQGRMAEAFEALADRPEVARVRHKGVMAGLDLCRPDGSPWPAARTTGHRAAMAARPRGAILRPLGDTLVLNPPLSITEGELDQLLRITAEAIEEASR